MSKDTPHIGPENGSTDEGPRAPHLTSRPKESERTTRRPAILWDRIRVGLFLVIAFLVIVWVRDGANSLDFRETFRESASRYWWLLALIGLEIGRQLYYLLQEQSERVYTKRNERKSGWDSRRESVDPFLRFRLGRLVKWLVILWILGSILVPVVQNADPAAGDLNPITALARAPALLLSALPMILQVVLIMFVAVGQFVAIFWFLSRGGIDTIMPDDIDTRFSDVKGQDAVLQRVKENIIFLEDPESIEEKGGYVPGGVLLWGPPGTGKTLMAQAVAGETGKPFVSVEPSAFINMFIGVGALKVKSLYRKLRKLATRYGGVIVFFDEADSLGSRGAPVSTGIERAVSPWTTAPACNGISYLSPVARNAIFSDLTLPNAPHGPTKDPIMMGGMGGGGGMGTLQALLSEMSGLTKPRGLLNRVRRWLGMKPKEPPKYRILHMFATNMPDSLDTAMRRPGRIDREYKVGYPQKEGRKATYLYYMDRITHELTDDQVDQLATISPYFSGAMIKDIVNEGLVIAIRDGRQTVTYQDVIQAKQLKQHGLPDDHEYIERERHSVAVHEACHAVVAYILRRHAEIDLATIERRGDIGGFVSSIPPEERFVAWRSENDIDLMTALASLAGERLFFEGDNSAGVGGDMRSATALASLMEGYWAMGDSIVSHSVTKASLRGAQPVETGADRNMWDGEFGKRVEAKLQELYGKTWELLEENRRHVLAVAHALETVKTITGEDVAAVIDGTVGPLVDGRPYQDPRFVEDVEAYHAACVAAQMEHGEVGAAVPIPVPPSPIDLAGQGRAAVTTGNGHAGPARHQVRIGPPTPNRPDPLEE